MIFIVKNNNRRYQKSFLERAKKDIILNKNVYLLALPIILYYIIFHYLPMFGVIIAFQDYTPGSSFLGNKWVGFKHFINFLTGPFAWRTIRNTFLLSILDVLFYFPAPIILALMINEIRNTHYKKTIQTLTYLPHFISLMVICGMIVDFSKSTGLINDILVIFGIERSSLLSRSELFRGIFISTNIWQNVGWGSIIYLAMLSRVSPSLYEAADIDGAGKIRKIIHISLPMISPVIIVQLILKLGFTMSLGFEKIILLYNPLTYDTADVISTFVFRRGLEEMNFSFGAAVGLFNSLINLTILYAANYSSRKFLDASLW